MMFRATPKWRYWLICKIAGKYGIGMSGVLFGSGLYVLRGIEEELLEDNNKPTGEDNE